MTQNKVIGVTGITGSGTSTVSSILANLGGFIINADKIAHEVMRKGGAAYDKIIETFGINIITPVGEIDRKKLGTIVFNNPEKLAALESIIHPQVILKTRELLAEAENHPFAVIDAPLLIESGMHEMCTSVWLVTTPDDVRLARIMARDGIDLETATRRLKSRAGDDTLRPYAHVVIKNDADIDSLKEQIMHHYSSIPERNPSRT